MSSLTLRIVLLCAVAFSQILGGASCCCLSRSMIASFSSNNGVVAADQRDEATANTASVPKCPKCAAAQAAVAKHTSFKGIQACKVGGTSQCQCAKAPTCATFQLEPRTPTVHFIVAPVLSWDLFPGAERVTVLGHEVPIRFGGHSWQAIACIWKI